MKTTTRTLLPLFLFAFGFQVGEANAGAGDFDKRFGRNGKVLLRGEATDVVTQRDRKVLVLRERKHLRGDAVIVSRLRRNGKIDRRFGRDGRRVIRLAGDRHAAGLALQSNGRIVVGFTSDPAGSDRLFGIARLRRGGKLDESFDGDGVQTSGFGPDGSIPIASDVAVTDDRKIVVAGTVRSVEDGTSDPELAVMRYTANGQLDPSFSGDGRQISDFEVNDQFFGQAVAVDSQGRTIVAGQRRSGSRRLALVRYDGAGELDPSFSNDGLVVSDVAARADDVLALPDDRIVVAGEVSSDFMVARFAADGAPDARFSANGVKTIDFSDGADRASSLTRDRRRLLVAGLSRTRRRGTDFAVARLRSNGSRDRRFSNDGLRQVDFDGQADRAFGVAVDRTRDVVLAGRAKVSGRRAGVVRLQGKGRR